MRDAETERTALERAATEAMETAQTRSAQIVGAARRDRDQLAARVDEARDQIDQLRREASDRARDHVQRKWEATTGALADTELELVGIKARRQIILAELGQLERSLEESRAHLRQHGAGAVETNDWPRQHRRDDHAVPAPERQRSALMPIEW
jgi:chromosome segregation ATPase